MIVRDLNVMSVSVYPAETNSPRVVDSYAVLAGTVTSEFLDPVTRRNSHITKFLTRVYLYELSPGSLLHLN